LKHIIEGLDKAFTLLRRVEFKKREIRKGEIRKGEIRKWERRN
jgi:hypothetical protein